MTTDLARQTDESRGVAVADPEQAAGALAHVLGTGDLYQLTNAQRVAHYINLCASSGLNPLSRPYQWIEFKEGEHAPAVLTLYFKPTAAAQALRNHHISVHYPRKEIVGELFVCEAHGTAPDGRTGVGTKYVPLTNKYGRLSGNRLANALMGAESGALRRLALNMGVVAQPGPEADGGSCRRVYVDGRGQVLEAPTDEEKALAADPGMARAIGEPTFEDAEVVPFEGPSQAPRPEELERPKREGPPPSFRASDEDVKRHLGAWFAVVRGTSLEPDHERARYVTQWTAGIWPENKQTDSLRTFFARATAAEAADLLAHTRAIVEGERQAVAEQAGTPWPDADAADEDGEPF